MKIFYSPKYEIDIGHHVFPMVKYRLIHDRLVREGIVEERDFIDPGMALDEDILLVHTPEYVKKLKTGKFSIYEIYKMEIPYKKEFMEPSWICANGTIKACKEALKVGIGIHIGGGFHHAYADHGEGFCIINDIAIGIRRCLKDGEITRAAIIDCDLHQGNGTAYIFRSDDKVFTFSIHEEDIYPYPKEQSDFDIGLPAGVGDEEYLNYLYQVIPKIFNDFRPDLVAYLAGADPYQEDQLGSLQLTMVGLKKRDKFVIEEAKKLNIPIAIVLGGGYAAKLEDTVTIHTNTIKVALSKVND